MHNFFEKTAKKQNRLFSGNVARVKSQKTLFTGDKAKNA